MDRDDVLLELAHKLEKRYGVQPDIFHKLGYVEIKDANLPDGPINPNDIETIIKEVRQKFNLEDTDLAYSINFGDIQVGFSLP